MGRAKPPQWMEYEQLAKKILSDLMPYADVTWNDHIVGTQSTARRQIDVSARWRGEDGDHLLIVSVKDWKTRADIKAVGLFISEIQDVQADRAILICSGGFSRKAVTYARNVGVQLMSLQTAKSTVWSNELRFPIIWEKLNAYVTIEGVFRTVASGHLMGKANSKLPIMSMDGGQSVADPLSSFVEAWNAQALDLTTGITHEFIPQTGSASFLFRSEDGRQIWQPISQFSLSYKVEPEIWLEYYTPAEARGFIDHLQEGLVIPTFIDLADFPKAIGKTATKIDNAEAVAIRARRFSITGDVTGDLEPNPDAFEMQIEELETDKS